MLRLATVLARGGSKGLAGKNARPFGGMPLLARTILQAKGCGLFDVVAFSSDSLELLEIAQSAGADELIHRPAELANDTISKLPGIRHALATVEQRRSARFDEIADLAVTSPLRSAEDIAGALRLRESTGAPVVLSANSAKDNPYFNIVEHGPNGQIRLCREPADPVRARQSAPECYALNGAVYIWTRFELLKDEDAVVRPLARVFLMPAERSVDIDDEQDFAFAEFIDDRSHKLQPGG
ncbi:MAG: acylneuraminate cytidylyltransferase family protein [Chromatiaceae bacterium]|nr:acylneuraminate cytidylyltransferase family protein [Chromatiaceae bacterium]